MANQIPEVVVSRLPLYTRALALLESEGREVVSSQELGARLHVTPAQIRKDLSYFGKFGKQGRGYSVRRLLAELRQILGLHRQWTMALVGVGRLGQAIASYDGFAPQGFRVVAAFDSNPALIGKRVGEVIVGNMEELAPTIRRLGIEIGIVAVPAAEAQAVIDALVECGVRGILNYAAVTARVPPPVRLQAIDPVVALQSMTFFLKDRSLTL